MILGAVLAGGMSTRFGSDKALAVLDGRTLLERAVASLKALCDTVVIVGRSDSDLAPAIADWPRPGMGPLAGVAAALRHGQGNGYASVLTCGVDCGGVSAGLLAELSPASAHVETQPVIGHWKSDAAEAAMAILTSEGRHSMQGFARAIGSRPVATTLAPANINSPADLAALEHM
ncbi:molybdenum cofactor guanylyltransferase [Alteraurantiacibacter buctensis]|uniref:NTP transferase domain-containing protein n=1 Tax=Alteraurantiacibacter buctensis TaxID=1503981 RepID=A0A844YRK7_9SPHN|nr:molybdenum cofactor guanylyltransferase [Alteraurantiacibacter buctensis]MXO70209.1 NTP transferase domain-containing protein [Alteraurantiacibacter buctensis]